MDFRGQEVDFREANLKPRLDAGEIDLARFDAQRKRPMARDDEGRWCAKWREANE